MAPLGNGRRRARSTRASMYELHGLRTRSEIPLDAPSADGESVALDLRWGVRRKIPDAPPAGPTLAHLSLPAGEYTLAESESEYVLRFHGICDFRISRNLREVDVDLDLGADAALVPVLFAGNVMAFVLAMSGACVLHASAVEVGEFALAFVGAPGAGKSTLAAMCCAAGATLVSDDLLRVEPGADSAWCFAGPTPVRLRPRAAELAERFDEGAISQSADGRTALRIAPSGRSKLPLFAIAVPALFRDGRQVQAQRLTGRDALVELIRYPRIVSWNDEEHHVTQFRVLAEVARCVPVYRLELPWATRFDPGLAETITCALGLPHPAATGPIDS